MKLKKNLWFVLLGLTAGAVSCADEQLDRATSGDSSASSGEDGGALHEGETGGWPAPLSTDAGLDAAPVRDRSELDARSAAVIDSSAASAMDAAPPEINDSGAADASADAGQRFTTGSAPPQSQRTFIFDPAAQLPFDALADTDSDRWSGTLEGAGYRIEVPRKWNGVLVMYAHGYVGPLENLVVLHPTLRSYLVANGFAWAASSFSKNYYDVRVGIEDTNKLARAFSRLAAENGRSLPEPSRRLIIGESMGGHIAAASLEADTSARAENQMRYDGALSLCGALGDLELFNYFAAYQAAALQLAGRTVPAWPVSDFASIRGEIEPLFFSAFPSVTTPLGEELKTLLMYLTGGPRPAFAEGFASPMWHGNVWYYALDQDGTLDGVLAKPALDTEGITFHLDADLTTTTPKERALNAGIFRVSPAPDANPQPEVGLRFMPLLSGELSAPLLALHTLGDMFVPFSMEQIYRRRVEMRGKQDWLVQRAIRAAEHCEFNLAEQEAAFDALWSWVDARIHPQGDDVLDRDKLAAHDYGCRFTRSELRPEEAQSALARSRAAIPACPAQ